MGLRIGERASRLVTRTLTPFRVARTGVTWRTPVEVRLAATVFGLAVVVRVALLAHGHEQTARKERDDHVGEKRVETRGAPGAIDADDKHQKGERVAPTLARGWGKLCTTQTCVMQGKRSAQGSQAEQRKAHDMFYEP